MDAWPGGSAVRLSRSVGACAAAVERAQWARQHDRRWAGSWSPERVAQRLCIDLPADEFMWISHKAIYQAVYLQGPGVPESEMFTCLRAGLALRVPRAPLVNGLHVREGIEKGSAISADPSGLFTRAALARPGPIDVGASSTDCGSGSGKVVTRRVGSTPRSSSPCPVSLSSALAYAIRTPSSAGECAEPAWAAISRCPCAYCASSTAVAVDAVSSRRMNKTSA